MTRARLANAVAFQLCWMAFVASAACDDAWLGFVPLALFAAWQLQISARRRDDLLIAAVAVAVGFVVDTLLAASGLVQYRAAVPSSTCAPIWILGLWAGFGLTLNHSLLFLRARPGLAMALGAIGGPVAYAAAAYAWKALSFGEATIALPAVAVAWAVVTPLLTTCAAMLASRQVLIVATRA